MVKALKNGALSVRESKAAELDARVKRELISKQDSEASKMTRLKALRVARDAAEDGKTAPKTNRAA